MDRLSFQVAGESHGPGLVAVLSGFPRNVPFEPELVQHWLRLRRETGGRGPRAGTEPDRFQVVSGISSGSTNGGPISFFLPNLDCAGHSSSPEGGPLSLEFPRPGHADLAGALKWSLADATDVAELASGRITAAYALVGAVCQMLLSALGISTLAHVVKVGKGRATSRQWKKGVSLGKYIEQAEASRMLCLSPSQETAMVSLIEQARADGDSLGGIFEVVAAPVPPGLGCSQPIAFRVDGKLAALIMGIPGVKAVALGSGLDAAKSPGSRFLDPVRFSDRKGFYHDTNRAGGVEGGITNGEPLVVRGIMKPLPSLTSPLDSVSLADGRAGKAARVRSD